ncbi:tripartite motif-containing protein 45-like [Ostrea edulis]|uniref:tripartite motif-containing protein 45-like n=1 Tax=Ostrea edulis TaxID=37623 RepID=UPI0024AF6D3D|nr:tripartite motif-containing protein 45-like [Ostrea edulis]
MLHPRRSAQEVLLCDVCDTVPLQSHCELCNISLCTNCVGKHLSDFSKRHNVIPFLQRNSATNNPKCPTHADKHCELFCEKCDIPVCSTCVSSGKHKGHDLSEVLKEKQSKIQRIEIDLEELKTRIYPRYEEIVSVLQTEKEQLKTNYGKLTTAADQKGDVWHRKITEVEEMEKKHLAVLENQSDEIKHRITELRQIIPEENTGLQ